MQLVALCEQGHELGCWRVAVHNGLDVVTVHCPAVQFFCQDACKMMICGANDGGLMRKDVNGVNDFDVGGDDRHGAETQHAHFCFRHGGGQVVEEAGGGVERGKAPGTRADH